MISNEKLNYKVVVLVEIYNFGFGRISIRGRLKNLNQQCNNPTLVKLDRVCKGP